MKHLSFIPMGPRRCGFLCWQFSLSSHRANYVNLYVSAILFGVGFQLYWYRKEIA